MQLSSVGRLATMALALGVAGTSQAGRPADYYDGVNTATSATARQTAGDIIRNGVRTIGYSNTWTRIFRTDEDPDNPNNVILVYGGQSRVKATGGTSNGVNDSGGWNREHAWPQGNFNSNEPLRSDLHALFPSDVDANTDRSDQDFGIVTAPFAVDYPDMFGNKDNNVHWEPANESKGKVARAMLYMDVRYAGTSGEYDLILQENGSGPDSGRMGRRSVVLSWHNQFPPTAFEIQRSAKIYEEQGNSNPFIDQPELAAVIFPDGPAWVPFNGTTITVSGISRVPGTAQGPGAVNVPLLTVALSMAEQRDFHVGSITVSKLGTVPDSGVAQMRLVFDADRSGTVSAADILVSTGTLSSGSTTFNLSGRPFRLGQGRLDLLVAADVAGTISGGPYTLGARLEANSVTHVVSGGVDINPTFTQQDSGLVSITGNVADGDTLSLSSTNLAPISALLGAPTVPLIRVVATPSAGEFDLAQLSVTRNGTAVDTDVPAVTLHLDANNNGVVDGGDQSLASTSFASGAATLILNTPLRFSSSTARSLILTGNISGSAVLDRTFGLTLNANSVLHAVSGGVDISGTNAAFVSNLTTILGTQSSQGASLIISEVYEGTAGNMKYVELRNVSTGSLSLSGIQLRRYSNANLTFTGINLSTTVTLSPGESYVVANNLGDFNTYFPGFTVNQLSGNVTHNGDDCYTLFDTISGTLIDGFASDNIGSTGNFALNVVAFRIESELPNDGSWGGSVQPSADGDSPSGYWQTRVITASNGNSATVGSPGTIGLPVSLSAYEIE